MHIGTIANSLAIIVGSSLGIIFHREFPQKIKAIIFEAIGLSIIIIGIQMALKVEDLLVFIFSILIGGIIGEAIDLEKHFENFGNLLKEKIGSENKRFTHGFLTSSLLFCVGSMAIVGSLNDGLRGDHSLLFTKSILDGFTSLALASTYGIGVLFSFIPILLYQGGITILSVQLQGLLSNLLVAQLTAVGGVLILGLGINLLEIKKIKITNLLPSLLIVIILSLIFK
jgi:hypothetical protein